MGAANLISSLLLFILPSPISGHKVLACMDIKDGMPFSLFILYFILTVALLISVFHHALCIIM